MQERFNHIDEQSIINAGDPYNIFLKNFDVTSFETLEDFINLSEDELEKLLSTVNKIFFTPTFYNLADEELFIGLLNELSKDKYVAILSDSGNNFISKITFNINYTYKKNYGIDWPDSDNYSFFNPKNVDYFVLDGSNQKLILQFSETVKKYEKRMKRRSSKKLKNTELTKNLSTSFEKITIGIDENSVPVNWIPPKCPHMLIRGNLAHDENNIIASVEAHCQHFNIPFTINHYNGESEFDELKNWWSTRINRSVESNSYQNADTINFIIVPENEELCKDKIFQNMLIAGRSMGIHIIMIEDRDNFNDVIFSKINAHFGLRVLLEDNYPVGTFKKLIQPLPDDLDFVQNSGYYSIFGQSGEFTPLTVK